MPRETRLTPQLQKKIVAAVKQGNYFSTACESCGIPEATGREWLKRGRQTSDEPYSSFSSAIKNAESFAEKQAIARIQAAARGRKVTVKKQKQALTKTGEVVELEETSESTEHSWQADAWYLERKFADRWGRKRMDVLEALGVLASADWIPGEIVEAAINGLGDARERVKEAFRTAAGTAAENDQVG